MDDSDAELFGESDDDDNPDGVRSAAALFGVLDLLDDDGEQNSKAATKDAFEALLVKGSDTLSFTGWHFGDEGLKTLAAAVSQSDASSCIVSISLEENDIGDEGFIELIERCAAKLQRLEKLFCTQNQITADGVDVLCKSLSDGNFAQLKVCDLNGNAKFGDKGLSALGQAVSHGSLAALTNLFLDNTSIGDEGLVAFARSLRGSNGVLPMLFELWLSNNQIGNDGAVALFDALGGSATSAMPKLGDLRLQYNLIGDPGIHALSSAVERGALSTAWYLGLAENAFSDAGVATLDAALRAGRLPRLEFLTISSAEASGSALESVQDTINRRRGHATQADR